MNSENRDYLIQLAEKNGLDVFSITHQTASNLQLVENNETTAFDILLVNKRIEDSIELGKWLIILAISKPICGKVLYSKSKK